MQCKNPVSLIPLAVAVLAVAGFACSSGEGRASSSTGGEGGAPGSSSSTTTSAGGGSGTGGNAMSCAASESAALADMGKDTPDGTGTPETAITIENVGGTGQYDEVVNMNGGEFGKPCPADACVKAAKTVSGKLAPFDEEITVNLRGPMELYDIGVYVPEGARWTRTSSWNRCGSDNLIFLNNKGGDASGVWTQCGGNSQSYATADGKDDAAAATTFGGHLDNEVEVNVMTAKPCTDASDCGFFRGVALHGWTGEKLFAIRARMPRWMGAPGNSYNDAPAIWMLNAQIVRTAQYGCNCRGVGSPGGCGELDVAEVLADGHLTHATSTIYSFQGAIGADGASGAGHYFLRPVNESATFVVIFSKTGVIQMLRLAPDAFDFGGAIEGAQVEAWLGQKGFSVALP
jgi:hypothetical protein